MKIGIIGSGKIGSTLARHWAKAGHSLVLSSRHPEQLKPFADELGGNAEFGTPEKAASEGEVVLLSIPLKGILELSDEVRRSLQGKVVIDTSNPYPERDGEPANEAFAEGTASWVQRQLVGVRVVHGFNTIPSAELMSQSHREGEPIGVPMAGEDAEALQVASKLARDAGFEAVLFDELSQARAFDRDSEPYGEALPVSSLRELLGARKAA